jgi:hypothetical protein
LEDLFHFISNTAKFEEGMPKGRTPQKVGQDVHNKATELVDELKKSSPNEKLADVERVYSEVRVDKGEITKIGGKPGGSKGALNPDLVGVRKGQTLSLGDKINDVKKKTQAVGDIKTGSGKITKKYQQLGGTQITVNGVTQSASTDPALLKGGSKSTGALAEKTVTKEGAEAAKIIGTESKEALSVATKTGGKEALNVAEKTGLKEGAKLVGTKAAKFVPFVGIGVGVALVAKDLEAGDYASAAWDAAEAIPVVGDVVGGGRQSGERAWHSYRECADLSRDEQRHGDVFRGDDSGDQLDHRGTDYRPR